MPVHEKNARTGSDDSSPSDARAPESGVFAIRPSKRASTRVPSVMFEGSALSGLTASMVARLTETNSRNP
ncbi:hypothetical protein D3C76_1760510 [compost metagenome]